MKDRIITQMREKGKTPENQLSDEEILSIQEKDFRLLMLKMMQDIGNKLEAKMDNLEETLGCQTEKREKGTEKIFQEIIAKNFPNMGKEPLTQI